MKPRPFLCVELLNTFSEKEMSDLNHFVSCPLFNADTYVIQLLKSLKENAWKKAVFQQNMQIKVYQQIFPNYPKPGNSLEKKERSLLNAKMSALTRLAEQFLMVKNIDYSGTDKYELLYQELLERKQFKLLDRHIVKDRKILNQESPKGEVHYEKGYKQEKNILNYFYQSGILLQQDNLPDVIHHLDMYYLLNKLSLKLTALSLQAVSAQKSYNMDKLEQSMAVLLQYPMYAEHPLVILFQANIILYEQRNDASYSRLLDLLDKYGAEVPRPLQKSFYTAASVYCISKLGLPGQKYKQSIFDLYQIMHNKNLLIEQDFISIQLLKNIITISCQIEHFEWAKEVLDYYYKFIPQPIRKSVLLFNEGVIDFYQKKFEEAHAKFIQIEKINPTHEVNTRFLILKCLYEESTEYSEATMQAFDTSKRFFKRHKSLTAKNKKGYENFIQILVYIYRIKYRASKTKPDRVKHILEQQKVNSDRRWLMEKINEL